MAGCVRPPFPAPCRPYAAQQPPPQCVTITHPFYLLATKSFIYCSMAVSGEGRRPDICSFPGILLCPVLPTDQHTSRLSLRHAEPGIILLREGTDTSQGKAQLISNINACQVRYFKKDTESTRVDYLPPLVLPARRMLDDVNCTPASSAMPSSAAPRNQSAK